MSMNLGPKPPVLPPGGAGRRPGGSRPAGRRRLALIGVAGESVGVLAGAAGWRVSGEPMWIIMAAVSFALALIMLRHV
jgi:hypothetical protein